MSDDNSTAAGGCERYCNGDDVDKTFLKQTIKTEYS
jgi:hypothetical protein